MLQFAGKTARRRFLVAVLIACLYSVLEPRKLWRRATGFFTLLFALRSKNNRAADWLVDQRINEGCKKCPVFYAPLRSCGSPLAENPELGCWCSTEVKAKISGALCWLDENAPGTDFGWKENSDAD